MRELGEKKGEERGTNALLSLVTFCEGINMRFGEGGTRGRIECPRAEKMGFEGEKGNSNTYVYIRWNSPRGVS